MRYASFALIALLAPTAAAEVELRFQEPATLEGDLQGSTNGWLAVRLPQGMQLDLELLEDGRLVMTNDSYPARLESPVTTLEMPIQSDDSGSTILNPMRFNLVAGPGGATVAMVVSGQVNGHGRGQLLALKPDGLSGALGDNGEDLNKGWSTWAKLATTGVAFVSHGGLTDISFQNLRVTALEWFNMQAMCPPDLPCPSGGGGDSQQVGTQGVYAVSTTYRFERLEASVLASASWGSVDLALAGPELDFWTDGSVHLPVADGVGCSSCPPIQDQSLSIAGTVHLAGIRTQDEGFEASLSGDFESARIDELWVSPSRLGQVGVASAAVIGFAIVVKLLIVPLFTRLSKQEALEHPKRQKIFHYIQEHPGANFREVARQTSIAAGTVRHHLTVLERAGHVVEHQHQGTVRLFENHGKFDHNWADLVLLREPPLGKLHTWLKANPGSPQKAALEAMEQEGWSRSTTQHRLSRLVEGGLATIRLQGRLKIYTATERVAPPPRPGLQVIVPANPALAS